MSTISTTHDHAHDHAHDHPHGWRRWLFATNHKDIGTMYLIFSFVSLLAGGVMALGIRLELFQPGLQYLRPEFFNQLTTMHGLVMVFGAIMPVSIMELMSSCSSSLAGADSMVACETTFAPQLLQNLEPSIRGCVQLAQFMEVICLRLLCHRI